MVSNSITCCSVTLWASTTHGIQCPQRKNTAGTFRPLERGLKGDQVAEYTPFAEGWLQGEKAWGRPVDVQVMPDGALLVSDDYAGAIYRISYQK